MKLKALILIGFVIITLFSAHIWYKADRWENIVISGDGWYEYPEASRESIRDEYNQAFKKIALLNGVFFASAFLSLRLFKDSV